MSILLNRIIKKIVNNLFKNISLIQTKIANYSLCRLRDIGVNNDIQKN